MKKDLNADKLNQFIYDSSEMSAVYKQLMGNRYIVPKGLISDIFPRIPEIFNEFGCQPFHIYHEGSICCQVWRLQSAFRDNNINFREYFAVKALPRNRVLSVLSKLGCGFDCSSIAELRRARVVGASPEHIMFTSNCTQKDEFEEAIAHGGCIVNIDDEIFLDKLPGSFPELFCCRLNPGDTKTDEEVNSIIGNPLDTKFGIPIEKIVNVYRKAQKLAKKSGVKNPRYGLHTMVCSGDLNYKHMVNTWKLCLGVAGHIYRKLGIRLEFINLGGGVGIVYRPHETEFNIEDFVREGANLHHKFSNEYYRIPMIYMECGRFITGPCGVYVNRVTNVYKKYKKFVGVQSAMPGLPRPGIYYGKAYHHPLVFRSDGKIANGPKEVVTICGSNCESNDVLAIDVSIPKVREGDFVVMCSSGAHCIGMTSNYNERLRPQELFFNNRGQVDRICRAELPEDLWVREV